MLVSRLPCGMRTVTCCCEISFIITLYIYRLKACAGVNMVVWLLCYTQTSAKSIHLSIWLIATEMKIFFRAFVGFESKHWMPCYDLSEKRGIFERVAHVTLTKQVYINIVTAKMTQILRDRTTSMDTLAHSLNDWHSFTHSFSHSCIHWLTDWLCGPWNTEV